MNELKPCPFCGGAGKIHLEEGYWFVSCDNCQSGTAGFYTADDAVDTWNERVKDGTS